MKFTSKEFSSENIKIDEIKNSKISHTNSNQKIIMGLDNRYTIVDYDKNDNPESFVSTNDLSKVTKDSSDGTIFYNNGEVFLGLYKGPKDRTVKEVKTVLTDVDEYLTQFGENKRTVSNVDTQDSISLDDAETLSELDIGMVKNSIIEGINATGILSNASVLKSKTNNKMPNEEDNLLKKKAFTSLEKIKNDIRARKNIKTTVKNGTYNSLTNIVGLAGIISAGSLGMGKDFSWNSNIFNDMLAGLTGASNPIEWIESISNPISNMFGNRHLTSYDTESWELDREELEALNTVAFDNIMKNKPGLKTGFNNSPDRYKRIKSRKEILEKILIDKNNNVKNTIGKLYVEPYYNKNKEFSVYEIPFEFNPIINEGSVEAKYNETQLLNKILPIRTYISSGAGNLQLETTYMALAPDYMAKDSTNAIDGWMYEWTNSKIEQIELKLRSLVMPNVANGNFMRPPIVQIRMGESINSDAGEIDSPGDLYKYPKGSDDVNNSYLKVTKEIDSKVANRFKRYIVTSVQITPLESYGASFTIPNLVNDSAYDKERKFGFLNAWENEKIDYVKNNNYRRKGFKVTMTMSETTKNFIDLVPDFKSYYDAWESSEALEQTTKQNNSELNNNFDYEDMTGDRLIYEMNERISKFWSNNSYTCDKILSNFKLIEKYEKFNKNILIDGSDGSIVFEELKKYYNTNKNPLMDFIKGLNDKIYTSPGEAATISKMYDVIRKYVHEDNLEENTFEGEAGLVTKAKEIVEKVQKDAVENDYNDIFDLDYKHVFEALVARSFSGRYSAHPVFDNLKINVIFSKSEGKQHITSWGIKTKNGTYIAFTKEPKMSDTDYNKYSYCFNILNQLEKKILNLVNNYYKKSELYKDYLNISKKINKLKEDSLSYILSTDKIYKSIDGLYKCYKKEYDKFLSNEEYKYIINYNSPDIKQEVRTISLYIFYRLQKENMDYKPGKFATGVVLYANGNNYCGDIKDLNSETTENNARKIYSALTKNMDNIEIKKVDITFQDL